MARKSQRLRRAKRIASLKLKAEALNEQAKVQTQADNSVMQERFKQEAVIEDTKPATEETIEEMIQEVEEMVAELETPKPKRKPKARAAPKPKPETKTKATTRRRTRTRKKTTT